VTKDIRAEVARYYDLNPQVPSDVSFYAGLVPSPTASVLELGCGTGRVLVPLAEHCGFIQGIDRSEAMLAICQDKLRRANVAATAKAVVGDITDFDFARTFDLIVAPYRVLQNLETDAQVDGLFRCLHRHLSPQATCVLNVFRPKSDSDELRRRWVTDQETLCWEVSIDGGRVTCHDRRPRIHPDALILYPELIWRRYVGQALVDEAVLRIPMRCYYPDEFSALIRQHGFRIINQWGGYAGEPYGAGPELIIQFSKA
jgi:SAM-dependent methyltransferase